jgi:hypothetical protein
MIITKNNAPSKSGLEVLHALTFYRYFCFSFARQKLAQEVIIIYIFSNHEKAKNCDNV